MKSIVMSSSVFSNGLLCKNDGRDRRGIGSMNSLQRQCVHLSTKFFVDHGVGSDGHGVKSFRSNGGFIARNCGIRWMNEVRCQRNMIHGNIIVSCNNHSDGVGSDSDGVRSCGSKGGNIDRVGSDDDGVVSCVSSGGNIEANAAFDITLQSSSKVKHEILMLSLPALAGQAIEPVTQLMETSYIGRLGSVELASAGISVSIFNMISKLFNIPLLSVSTSLVAEDISKQTVKDSILDEKKQLPSVSTALLLAVGIGIVEAVSLYLGSGFFLDLMGITKSSTMRNTAQKFLSWRAIGAPAVVVSLALHGIFRGFKDTKTPVICLGLGNIWSVMLFPVLMYYFRMGLLGAAVSTVVSQYAVTFFMVWLLSRKVILLPPKWGALQFGNYMKSGGFLIGRTLSVLITMTLATSMAARQGTNAMAAHQICMQVWLAVSLLTDAISASAQAMIASAFSKGDYATVLNVTKFVVKVGVISGISLAVILGFSFGPLADVFTKDPEVLRIVKMGAIFVSVSQPASSLAFIVDGIHFGVSDFAYAAYSMMAVAAISSVFLLYAPAVFGLRGVWSGLVLFMALRVIAGCIRFVSKSGPWSYILSNSKKND